MHFLLSIHPIQSDKSCNHEKPKRKKEELKWNECMHYAVQWVTYNGGINPKKKNVIFR